MVGVEKSSPYREMLFSMINLINRVTSLSEENQVLIVLKLNTEEKIRKWFDWLRPKWKNENELEATEAEIVRAAVQIDKGIL